MDMKRLFGGTAIEAQMHSLQQRIQECAKILVNKCESAKKRIAIFSDVCFFFFWRQRHLQILAIFLSLRRPSA